MIRSGRFQEIAIVSNITAVQEVRRVSLAARLDNYLALARWISTVLLISFRAIAP